MTTYTLNIVPDDIPESPREWDNLGIMACSHSRYQLGDPDFSPEDIPEDAIGILPLYLYDHSGITMNTTGFSCNWDSGQVGYIYTTKDKIKEYYGDNPPTEDKIEEHLRNEVATYDTFIRGEIYGFTLESDGEHSDSCFGFYDITDIVEHLPTPLVNHLKTNNIDIEYGENVLTLS